MCYAGRKKSPTKMTHHILGVKKLLVGVSVVTLTVVGCAGQSQGFKGTLHALFVDAPTSAENDALREKEKQDPTIKRSRHVLVKVELLRSQEGLLALNLFGDLSLTAMKDRMEVRSENRYTWYGHIEGVEHSQVILVVEGGSLAGSITTRGDLYQIRDIGGGIHAIYEIDQSALPPHADPIPVP